MLVHTVSYRYVIVILPPPPLSLSLHLASYLNVFEESDLKIEKDFFKSHPELGYFEKIPIYGTLEPPPQQDLELIKVSRKLPFAM